MTVISKNVVGRSLSAHAAIGLLASALLYLVCLTGSFVVFYQEWQRIEQPVAPEMSEISPQAVLGILTIRIWAARNPYCNTRLRFAAPTFFEKKQAQDLIKLLSEIVQD